MCGIVGIWDQSNGYDRDELSRDLKTSVRTLSHRGPDDNGTWLNARGLGLGHTRLSILDLSSHGHQPMISTDGRFIIVYNGEVYNFADIREKLSTRGHTFRGSGDTEVILAAFQQWGDAAVQQFIGMFAIALWDTQEEHLRLFRDRIGVKPLYYAWDGKYFWFGSELKAIHPFRHWQPEIDAQSVGEFLQYGYVCAPRTIYKGVRKLLPGHRLRISNGREPTVDRYWDITDVLDTPFAATDESLESELEDLMASAFSYRMISDVPVGLYLSGGVDSSLVAAILAKHHPQTIHTFTIGFSESSHDESRWARKVAAHLGTEHTEYVLGGAEALQIAKDWGTIFDEPFGDPSGIPTLLVSQLASQEVKVVLSADGGDELFSGYAVYESFLRGYKRLGSIPRPLARFFLSGLQMLPETGLRALMSSVGIPASTSGRFSFKLNRYKRMLHDLSPGALYDLYLTKWLPEEITNLLGSYSPPRNLADSYSGDLGQQISLWDFDHYLPDDILTKVDRTTMLTSIEGREPLLDHRLAEFAFRLPIHLRRGELGSKHILKKILYKHVPRELVDRPKQGFAIPTKKWLREDLRELVDDYLNTGRIRQAGIFDPSVIEQTTRRFLSGDDLLTTQLWFTLAFEMWREEWT